ncbi:hypothetical protein [Amycolatopsis sp. cmx-4-54]|uniref:hypothetical protein n=1 Tax=Amycolatopsis sp. cmx-4-54 TaxID=2790936 RepID=UPI00397DAE0A
METIPGLVLTEAMYERTAAGVAEFPPHVGTLSRSRFVDAANWLNIPDLDGEISKSELTLLVGVEATVKLNVWFRPDIRGGAEEQIPHNHRWNLLRGHILRGAYRELRFRRVNVDPETDRADIIFEPPATYCSPDVNEVAHGVFHEIDWCEPGTMSLTVCDYGEFGDWSHLDLATGMRRKDQPVAGFRTMLAALNPHRPDLQLNAG